MNLRANTQVTPWNQLKEAINIRKRFLGDKQEAENGIKKQNNLLKVALHRALRPVVDKNNVPISVIIRESSIDVLIHIRNMDAGIATSNIVFTYNKVITLLCEKDLSTIVNETDKRIEYYRDIKEDNLLPKREEKVPVTEPVVVVQTKNA